LFMAYYTLCGHSSGEIAAAYAARILTLEECVRIAYARGLAAKTLSDSTKIRGAMLAVGASVEEVQSCIHSLRNGRAVIACVNRRLSVTLSGDEKAIAELQSTLDERGFLTRRLKVDVAYHSHHMQLALQQYRSLIGEISPQTSHVPFYSAVHGRAMLADELHADYWVDNLILRVEFVQALKGLLIDNTKVTTLVEIGSHCALQTPLNDITRQQVPSRNIEYLPSLKRKVDAMEALQQLAISLLLRGFPLNLESKNFPVMAHTKRRPVLLTNLRKYPWNHSERYWHSCRLTSNLYHREICSQ
jgi:acyl transferase domain-containing protein